MFKTESQGAAHCSSAGPLAFWRADSSEQIPARRFQRLTDAGTANAPCK